MSTQAPPVNDPVPTVAPGHAHGSNAGLLAVSLGALGVVYGDIGTSPLYALKECVHGPHAVAATNTNIVSLLSLIFWSITLVVSVKYLGFVTRADNAGEGGILAMLALLPKNKSLPPGRIGALVSIILCGAALLYGDGVITPAMSVLSAVEGLRVATNAFDQLLVPITVSILVGLFVAQKRGTDTIGRVFGPIMLLWFTTLAVLGLVAIMKHPSVLSALNPYHAVAFFGREPMHAFLILGSVVLCITGAEALYADMGHFGRMPIQLAWYAVAYPALILNYFGQGALLLDAAPGPARMAVAENPFYALAPEGIWVYPLVVLATLAAVIASQALISGAFSLTRAAVQLGFLPRMTVKHTSSATEGQIYIPTVNWLIAIGCIALVLEFRESSKLAAAYGIATTGTMVITSITFFNVARRRWNWSRLKAGSLLTAFLLVDLAFLGSNALKFLDGGFLPVLLALGVFTIMRTWKRGRAYLTRHFASNMRPLDDFIDALRRKSWTMKDGSEIPIVRVPGAAVFMTSQTDGVPPLLLHHVHHVRSLHETVILVTIVTERVPRVMSDRFEWRPLSEGLARLTIRSGYMQSPSVPAALEVAFREYQIPVELSEVTYFLGRETLLALSAGEMGRREEALFAFLTRNSQGATRYFGIPPARVVELGMQIDL